MRQQGKTTATPNRLEYSMATGKRPPSGVPGERRRRPTPTINLKATEVASEPVAPATEPVPPPAATTGGPPEPPPVSPPEPPRPGFSWLLPEAAWPLVAAGAAGAAAVLLFVGLIWLVTPRSEDAAATLTPRLAVIETQLRDLAARPLPLGADPQVVEAVSARLAKLEGAVSTARPPATDPALLGRVGALEGAIKPLGESVGALARRVDEADAAFRNVRGRADTTEAAITELRNVARTSSADHGELEKLVGRIAALEKADRAMADELAKRAAMSGDRPVRLAVAAAALRAAVERGEPYSAEFAALRPLTTDSAALAAVERFAKSGLPAPVALGRELVALLPALQRAAGTVPRDNGFLDRLQANAERLVRIRPIDEVPGEDTAAIMARIEVRAAQADVAGALVELGKLPAPVRALAAEWMAKAQARSRAVEASRKLDADAISALSTTQ